MSSSNSSQNEVGYSFSQLIKIRKDEYFKKTLLCDKENIATKFIYDPDISYDLLNNYVNLRKSGEVKSSLLFEKFDTFYHTLQYSLPKEKNNYFYEILKTFEQKNINASYEYLAHNDPINNFKNLCPNYALILKEDNEEKLSLNIIQINKYIDMMLKVYDINFRDYYFPPMKEYPTYAYNFFSFLFFKTLKEFKIKKIYNKQKKEMEIVDGGYTKREEIILNIKIAKFFETVSNIFEKFNYSNINKDLISLKLIYFYFKIFEYSRNYDSIANLLKEMVNCLDSEMITSDILKRFQFYRNGSKIQIKEEEWNSIGINEEICSDSLPGFSIKIKHFKKDLLKLSDIKLLTKLESYCLDNLNILGFIQNSIIKYNDEIEEYSKILLKSIFSSDIYLKSFLKNDKRFEAKNSEKEKLLNNFFKGVNSDIIFEEIWENIFFLPFPIDGLGGFNTRAYYSIFVNTNYNANYQKTFQEIIPLFHCYINTLIHEFTYNIALLLAANLDEEEFETIIIKNDKDLINLQTEYSKKYKQNNIIYDKFYDLGDLIEVEIYGVRQRKFKTFSGLFCLDYNSYNNNVHDDFRKVYVELYNCDSIKDDKNEIFKKLMNSEIANLLEKYFSIISPIKNESFIMNSKPRKTEHGLIINEEYSININYCDKLDKI